MSDNTYITSLEVEEVRGPADFEHVGLPSLLHPFLFLDLQLTHLTAHCCLNSGVTDMHMCVYV